MKSTKYDESKKSTFELKIIVTAGRWILKIKYNK